LHDNKKALSSANSINWGRLVPQIVYYFSAYCDMLSAGEIECGDEVNICVPTGNFGNIFGAYIAKRMGLPIGTLICASNANNVLTDFFNKGIYDRRRDFHTTISPSMDILISSNLERLLCLAAGSEKTVEYMTMLKTEGVYTVGSEVISAIDKEFKGYFASEEDTKNTIKSTLLGTENLIDTHTAVALFAAEKYRNETKDLATMVVASTASPYKFASDVYASIKDEIPADGLEALNMLVALTGVEIPYPLKGIADRKVRFEEVIDASDMPQKVLEFAK
jgi:threonine synthase